MDLSALLSQLRALPEFKSIQSQFREQETYRGELHLPRAVRAPFAAAHAGLAGGTVLYLLSREDRVLTLEEELRAWDPSNRMLTFPQPNPLFYERGPWGPRTKRARIAALVELTRDRQPGAPADLPPKGPTILLASARAVMTRTISPRQLMTTSRWLKTGSVLRLDRILELLVDTGYSSTSVVSEPGQFSRRGGILDLWPASEARPVRIEFFGDQIDTMRHFDPASQRSQAQIDHLRIAPAREGLPKLREVDWDRLLPQGEDFGRQAEDPYAEFFLPWMNSQPMGLIDYLPENASILIDDRTDFQDTVAELEQQAVELRADQERADELPTDFPLPYLTLAELNDSMRDRPSFNLGLMSTRMIDESTPQLDRRFTPGPRFGGQLRPLLDHISRARASHSTVAVVSRQASRLAELWAADGSPETTQVLPESLSLGDVHFIPGALSEGWILSTESLGDLHLLTDAEIFGWSRPKPRPRRKITTQVPEAEYADLKPGNIVVHIDYGVGRFLSLVDREIDEMRREYLLIEYAEGDQLYVPIHQADRLTPYVGVDRGEPALSRLGAPAWERDKARAQEAVQEVAEELLELYAQRMTIEGYAFPPDTEWQHELEASFPYEETEDQLRAIEAVKRDMERQRPMDRLLCGDVGYGKTEIALRAAFKAVMGGRQVAILVPTTVLAQQHYNTFRERLAPFPVNVDMLSRFRSQAEAEEILGHLKEGVIDIIIGTHRLLQPGVEFKQLGLLIIDEEQRFGVTHKE
jgi:transcription-repair coupling factor (superfamily II helicase)